MDLRRTILKHLYGSVEAIKLEILRCNSGVLGLCRISGQATKSRMTYCITLKDFNPLRMTDVRCSYM